MSNGSRCVHSRHGAEQYTEDLAVMFFGCHLDRTIPEIATAYYYSMPSLVRLPSVGAVRSG